MSARSARNSSRSSGSEAEHTGATAGSGEELEASGRDGMVAGGEVGDGSGGGRGAGVGAGAGSGIVESEGEVDVH